MILTPIVTTVTVALSCGKTVNAGVMAVGMSIAYVVFNALMAHRLQLSVKRAVGSTSVSETYRTCP